MRGNQIQHISLRVDLPQENTVLQFPEPQEFNIPGCQISRPPAESKELHHLRPEEHLCYPTSIRQVQTQHNGPVDYIRPFRLRRGRCPGDDTEGLFSHALLYRPHDFLCLHRIRPYLFIFTEQLRFFLSCRQPHIGMSQTTGPGIVDTGQNSRKTFLTLKNADHRTMTAADM